MVLLTPETLPGKGGRDETDDADRAADAAANRLRWGKGHYRSATDTSWTPVIRRRLPIRE